jgi:hypothetical protein
MSNIQYYYGTKKVRQAIGTIYRGDFEGDFGEVLNSFMAEYASYKKYLDEPHEVTERSGYGKHLYLDGTDKKTVKFDSLHLDWQDTYDDEKELRVVGERAMDAGELAAYEAELEKSKEREIEQLRKLKEKYPNV